MPDRSPPVYVHEHGIAVVFDLTGPDRITCARALAIALSRGKGVLDQIDDAVEAADLGAELQSWWFPEPDLKHVDRNDNGAFDLVPHEPQEEPGYLIRCVFDRCRHTEPVRGNGLEAAVEGHGRMEQHYRGRHAEALKAMVE